MSTKQRVYQIVEVAGEDDRLSRAFDVAIMALIALNVAAVILETVESIQARFGGLLFWFEMVSVAVFTIEYALRIWSCTEREAYRRPVVGRLRFAARPMLLIDLLAILPAYLMLLTIDLRFIRLLRLMRLFRILKVGRYSVALRTLSEVLRAKKEELLVTLSALLMLLVMAAALMYYAEHEAQPEVFSSIPAAMWWAVATLTTVGYGDVYPVTPLGRLLASVIAILGIGMFALPAGILGGAFAERIGRRQQSADPEDTEA